MMPPDVHCPRRHRVFPSRLSVCEGMWYCNACSMYYPASHVTPRQPETPYQGRPSERP